MLPFIYRPTSSYTWRIKFKNQYTGKRQTISTNTRDKKLAQIRLKEFITLEHRNQLPESIINKESAITFKLSDLAQYYFQTHPIKPVSQKLFIYSISSLIFTCKDKPVQQYTNKDYYNWVANLNSHKIITNKKIEGILTAVETDKSLSENSKASYARHLRILFNFAIELDLIRKNPVQHIKRQKKEVQIIPQQDLNKIFDTLIKIQTNNQLIKDIPGTTQLYIQQNNYYDIIKLLYLGAYRLSEVIHFTNKNYQAKSGILNIPNGKGSKTKIPVVDDLQAHLEYLTKLDKTKEEIRLFPKLTASALQIYWKRLMQLLGMRYTIHQLRKTRGSFLANLGVDPLFLRDYMRHESIRTTEQYYIKVNINLARENINKKLRQSDTNSDTKH